ncbi:MAG: radical SAM protein [Clostridia bacterium]|nr:radical SAM protein [Clostridia bacterium]
MIERGRISRIQYFSTGDGDGIRTTVFMQGCNLRCAWCHNPETQPLDTAILNYSEDKRVLSGEDITADELFKRIIKDEVFYIESGGGVTFSGGEPLLQADFLSGVAKMCKGRGINVLFDTAGCVPYQCFERVAPYTDTFYFDVKAVTKEDCEKYRCGDPKLVLDNLKRLCLKSNVVVRVPIIPGHNNSKEKIEQIAGNVADAHPSRVDLLPFHRLGAGKYRAMNKEYDYLYTEPLKKSDLEQYVCIFEDLGLKCRIEK